MVSGLGTKWHHSILPHYWRFLLPTLYQRIGTGCSQGMGVDMTAFISLYELEMFSTSLHVLHLWELDLSFFLCVDVKSGASWLPVIFFLICLISASKFQLGLSQPDLQPLFLRRILYFLQSSSFLIAYTSYLCLADSLEPPANSVGNCSQGIHPPTSLLFSP